MREMMDCHQFNINVITILMIKYGKPGPPHVIIVASKDNICLQIISEKLRIIVQMNVDSRLQFNKDKPNLVFIISIIESQTF